MPGTRRGSHRPVPLTLSPRLALSNRPFGPSSRADWEPAGCPQRDGLGCGARVDATCVAVVDLGAVQVIQATDALWFGAAVPVAATSLVVWLAVGFAAGCAAGAGLLFGLRQRLRCHDASSQDFRLESAASFPAVLAKAGAAEAIARALVTEVEGLLGIDVAALALVDEDGRVARGAVARVRGTELAAYRDVVYDLHHEPSGVATATFEAASSAVFDAS